MDFTIVNKQLIEMISLVINAIGRSVGKKSQGSINDTNPIVSNFLIELSLNNKLSITAYDGEIQLRANTILINKDEIKDFTPGKAVISAKVIQGFCKTTPMESEISITSNGNTCNFSFKKTLFSIEMLHDGTAFPKMELDIDKESISTICTSEKNLKDLLCTTSFAQAIKDARHVLLGSFISLSGDILMCGSSDGRRLALNEVEVEPQSCGDMNIILPKKITQEFQNRLRSDNEKIYLYTDGITFLSTQLKNLGRDNNISLDVTTRLVDGRPQDLRKVIPNITKENTATLNFHELKSTIQRVSTLSDEQLKTILLTFNILGGNSYLKVMSIDKGTSNNSLATAELDIYECSGETVEIKINSNYLLDALNAVQSYDTKQIKFHFFKSNSSRTMPILLTCEEELPNLRMIIMPIR